MRSHYCGEINESLLGKEIEVCGWVHRRRDHGGVIFIDLRDREGLLQVVFDPDRAGIFELAERIRSEFVLRVKGLVRARPEGTVNPNMRTGRIEVLAQDLEVLNKSETPPFHHDEQANEDIRLKYRYLDLRREKMLGNLMLRHKVTMAMRDFLDNNGFVDVETPMLTRATPEGARDYIVPSRTNPGKFFALPQSPQLFKQLLMMSGLDRYYQIVRCFRDEDLRADRQPEFTQLDIEMSFVDETAVTGTVERMIRHVFKKAIDVDLMDPFPRMTYAEAMHRYGSDKPDLRIDLELVEVSDLMNSVEFKVFAAPAADPEGRVAALCVPGGADISRKIIDDYTSYVARYGARGLAYIKVNDVAAGRENLELHGAHEIAHFNQLKIDTQVRFVGAVAMHCFGVGHARKRLRKLDVDRFFEDMANHALDSTGYRGLVDEAHLDIELREFRLTVGPQVFVAEATHDLVVAVQAGHHQQLLEQLR